MAVDTKKVAGRRTVHYDSLDDLLADAEQLATGEVRTVGNWTLGQILKHLAAALNSAIDGTEMKFPWIMKKIFLLFMNKEKMLNEPLSPGFTIPKNGQAQFSPEPSISTEDGLAALRAAIERYKTESNRADHPLFGEMPEEEWTKFNLRHAEMHMSFARDD